VSAPCPAPPGRHSARATPALRALVEADPAVAALSLWCAHRDGARTRTQGTVIAYGPDFPQMPAHEQRGLAAHHVLHVALRHPARMGALEARLGAGFDADLYALAADALVNEALLAADHALPRPAVTLTGLVEAALGERVAPEAALSAWSADRLYFALARGGEGGEGAAERARAYASARNFRPDLEPEAAAGGGEGAEEEARWRRHLARAMEAGRVAGRGLGRIGHRLADIPAPRVPWEVVLRGLLSRAVLDRPQPQPTRPARRWVAAAAEAERRGTPVPGFEPAQRRSEDVPRVVLALDASGSIDAPRLELFWAEVLGVALRLRAELHLLVFDEAVRHRERIDPARGRPRPPALPRDGGTDFAPPIREAEAMGAAALVLLTDLEGDPGPRPRIPTVIWAVPDGTDARPPWGRLLDLTA
jgi:predicted metal-dependent peptidase